MRTPELARIMTSSALCASLFVASGTSRADVIERVACVVNDDAIYLSEVREEAAPYVARAMRDHTAARRLAAIEQIYAQVLHRLVDQELVEQAAEAADIVVTDADVDRAIARVRLDTRLPAAQFWSAVAQQGFGAEADYRADVRAQLLYFRVSSLRMGSRVDVTEDDVRRRYDESAPADEPYESARMTIYEELRQTAMQRQAETMIDELRRDAAIDCRLE